MMIRDGPIFDILRFLQILLALFSRPFYRLAPSTLLTDSVAELAAIRDDIQNKMRPYTDASTGQVSHDLQLLFSRLQHDMLDAKERSTEYLSELKAMVEQNTEDLNSRINTYANKLKKRVNKDTAEIRE